MTKQIDESFGLWLTGLAKAWGLSDQEAAFRVAESEIENRIYKYPKLRECLKNLPLDLHQFTLAARECWALGGRWDKIHFDAFIAKGSETSEAIESLIRDFPKDDNAAAKRIDSFIRDAVNLGFSKPKGNSDWAGAAQVASLVLTAVNPERFADYRQLRWKKFAEAFDYPTPPAGSTHGDWIVWAGTFAAEIAAIPTYKRFWPSSEAHLTRPLWVISGLCWEGLSPAKPVPDPVDPESRFFPEGAEKRRLHLIRERNRTVVAQAKALRLQSDPMLCCEVCGFSFLKAYGDRGKGFIEAHHIMPIAELKAAGRTRVEDLALLCSNCHKMIHSGENTLTLSELQGLLTSVSRA